MTSRPEDDKTNPAATHVVRQGDCIESIAEQFGHFWRTLWNHAANASLKRERKDPNVLMAGDRVTIPPLRDKKVELATTRVHRFRRRGVPSRFHLQLLDEREPMKAHGYTLQVSGKAFSGKTDDQGRLDHPIPPRAREATLTLEDGTVYRFALGYIDPIDTIAGTAQRLHNLGYDCRPTDDAEALSPVLRRFQRDHHIALSGENDDATQKALLGAHGC